MKNVSPLYTEPFFRLVSAAVGAPAAQRPDNGARAQTPAPRASLLDRLDRWLWTARQRDLEQALTSATDVADVEARLRARERSLLQRYY